MTNPPVNPSMQNPVPPDFRTILAALGLETSKQINCARVGIVQSFNGANATAVVQLAQQQVISVSPAGLRTLESISPLLQVPVYTLGGGGVTVTFPIAAGDECLVIFNDRELDNWLLNGGITTPSTPRIHDFSDGLCFVGFRSFPRSLGNVSASEAQLRTDNGLSFVGINPSTGAVRVHANSVYEWDVHGYGQKITWTGGANYTIDNYTIGATITTNNHSISPPGPP